MNQKILKLVSLCMALGLICTTCSTIAFAAEPSKDTSITEVQATITGVDNSLSRSEGYAVVHGKVDIKDDNHIFNKNVEVWAVADTWLTNWSSGTANGIPDWTLYAKAQILVSNGDVSGWLSSPLNYNYDQTSVSAQTKVVHAKDGGEAEAQGFHNVKDYYGESVWTYTSSATERF